MEIGIISDIHGNHYALREVLNDFRKKGIEKILVLGDIVGYYYHPEIILELLSSWDYEIIKGNHEELLEELYNNKIESSVLITKYGRGHEVALKKLNEETLQWLFFLPEHKTVEVEGVRFQLNHGSPNRIDEYIYPDAPNEKLEECNSILHDFVLIGHSHYSFSYQCKNSVLINCGSVGQSRQKGGVAYWASVNTDDKTYSLNTTSYDVSDLLLEVKKNDPEAEYMYNILQR
ncbi:metallophosphoesterase family protein [Flavobacterium sp.]|uniref:metallophosphoesterase family protein n=1 Tax=Flavobacterium sp. TaxID=239 RepID=UPI0031D7D72E